MTVYNINLGIGWASSGVEYAQSYRNQSFKKLHTDAKFIFSDLILGNNIEDLTKNLGFDDDEIIYLYNYFTDIRIAPSDYTVDQWKKSARVADRHGQQKTGHGDADTIFEFPDEKLTAVLRYHDKDKQTIDQVSFVTNGLMVRRDFYSYTKYAAEYYSGQKDNNHVVLREFYNEDGSVAYTQHLDDGKELFEFPNQQYFYSKNDLYLEFLKRLNLTAKDVLIIDRLDEDKHLNNAQLIFEHHGPAKLVVAVHADHFDKHFTNDQRILWNNFYEYQFSHPEDVYCYVVATDKQNEVLTSQLQKYYNVKANVVTIPVGNLSQLRKPDKPRQPHSLITASRLANEKHIDWLVEAVAAAHRTIPDLTFKIYGQGGQAGRLQELIKREKAGSYIKLMGQQNLTDVYKNFAAYIAGSTSEGFGLSLLEAVGSGLPMIGFDVPYGNPTFIDNGKNGYLLPYQDDWSQEKKIVELTRAILELFQDADQPAFVKHSYEIAEPYLTDNVAKLWGKLLEELDNA